MTTATKADPNVIVAKRGSDFEEAFTIMMDGKPLDITGATNVVYLLKVSPKDLDADAVIAFTTTLEAGVQLLVTSLTLGQIKLKALAAKMALAKSKYFGGLQMTHPTYGLIEFPSNANHDVWKISGQVVLAAA